MIKKKSRTLAFVLAASLIMPTIEGTVLAATNEEKTIIQESNINTDSLNQSTETSEESIFELGDGSQENPFTINTLEQLKAFRDSVNNGNKYQGKYIKLTSSIDLSGENWEPIGREDKPFLGAFDGGNNEDVVISNLKIEKGLSNQSSNNYVGLFGKVGLNTSFANKIENITIRNADVTGSLNVGVVVGDGCIANGVSNIKIEGDIKVKGYWYVGGISGGQYSYFSISNSKVDANKGSFVKGVKNGSGYIGGIIGQRGEGNYKISSCYVNNIEIGGADRLGGISGCAQYENIIEKCIVENTIIRQDQTNENADTLGTIAGANQACSSGNVKILDCVVKNTYAYIRDSNEPITQKISMLNNGGNDVKTNVIVGDNVKEENGKVIDGEFEILTSDMYDSSKSKLGDIGNNKYILVPKDTMAIINKTPYNSLEEAISASNEGDTIRLIEEVEINSPIDLSGKKSRTIDFNGKQVKPSNTFNGDKLVNISDSSDIIITNGNFIASDSVNNIITITNSSNVKLDDMVLDKTNSTNKGAAIYIEKSNVDIPGELEIKGDINHIKAGIEVNGEGSHITLNKGGDIETQNKVPEIIYTNGANEDNSFEDENKPTEPNIPSKPIYPTYDHTSIIGSDRYDTAAKIADELGSYNTAVLVNATSTMSDGLAASGLAGKEDAAILLTKKDSIPKATMDRLKKVKKVYIIGGENAISGKVSSEITKNVPNVKVERLGGKTRVETSEIVAKKLGNYKKAFVVNGFKGEADAMSASAVAAREEAPILLTNGKTSTHTKKSGVKYYVVGGKTVMNDSIVSKYNAEVLAGDDRYETNRKVINEFYGASETLYFSNGETLVDALTASTIAKDDGLVLVGRKSDNSILNRKNTIQVGGMNFDVDFEK